MKKGIYSTEFWLTAVAMLVGLLMASGVWGEGEKVYTILGWAAAALSSMGYSVSRGLAKAGEAKASELAMLSAAIKGADPSPPSTEPKR